MLDIFLFAGMPYAAILICVIGVVYRYRHDEYHVSSLSSQFLEGKKLLWGSAPWHIGIIVIFLGHLVALVIPGLWHTLMAVPLLLIAVEIVGIAVAVLCVVGLIALIFRRITSTNIQSVTTTGDLVVLGLLLFQIVLGLATAVMYRWGSSWSTGTLTPYIWGLLTFRPNLMLVNELPLIIQAHLIGAWLILIAIPFSRLIHMFSIPLDYLYRPAQRVVWNNPRRQLHTAEKHISSDSRRYFLKGATGLSIAGLLLSVGVLDKLFKFFQTPDLSHEEEATLMETRLKRLRLTAQEKELELERLRSESIFVAYLDELEPAKGKYFIIPAGGRPAVAAFGKVYSSWLHGRESSRRAWSHTLSVPYFLF